MHMLIDAVFNKMFVCLILGLWLFSLQFTKAADVNSVVTIARNGTACYDANAIPTQTRTSSNEYD